ncbi:MAG: type III-B CRISPR-associated protein Cas10/Cmr2 [Burkholderiales bacterium]|nr:type III-B CRISPR-associated protein Cas10/Cmr2 [Burkholderiales bacterium]
MAISAALNDFSQFVARHVVEEEYRGRLIYSGGDDVLAVLPVADLLGCAQRLRHAYSGVLPEHAAKDWREIKKDRERLYCKNGYAWLRGRLMRMMGSRATASAGVVVAHHQAPLAMVLRELRETEQAAKHEGERDAVAVRVIKRSGGAAGIVLKWADLPLLQETVEYLRHPDTSRRAVYHSLAWLRDLPDPRDHASMCQSLLAYQFERQSKHPGARSLAVKLVEWAAARSDARQRLCNLLQTAEFLAREVRAPEAGDALAPSSTRRTEVAV